MSLSSQSEPNRLQAHELLTDLERKLRAVIEQRLSKKSKNWWKQLVPQDVRKNAEEAEEIGSEPFPWIARENPKLVDYLDFTA
jgi:hypothetical protein